MSGKDGYQDYLDQSASAANAAGVAHHDPNVQARQNRLAGGVNPAGAARPVTVGGAAVGVLMFCGLIWLLYPFVAYYASLLQAFSSGGWEVGGVLVNNVIVDAILIFSALSGFYFFTSRKSGYFLPLGIICLPIGFADSFPVDSVFHGSLVWILLSLFAILILLSIFRARSHNGHIYYHISGIALFIPIVVALSAFLVGVEAGTYRSFASGLGYDLSDPDRVTGLSTTTFFEALDYVWPSFAAYLILFSIVRGIFWLVERLRKKL